MPCIRLCIFYLSISGVENQCSFSMGVVNKVFQMHDLTKLRILLCFIVNPLHEIFWSWKEKVKGFCVSWSLAILGLRLVWKGWGGHLKSPFIYSYFLSGSATLNRHHLIALNGKKLWEQQKCLYFRSVNTCVRTASWACIELHLCTHELRVFSVCMDVYVCFLYILGEVLVVLFFAFYA
jgi:hypothetical protein